MMRKSAGGAATAGGVNYQQYVAAWITTHILAEKQASPPWNLSADTNLEWLLYEVSQPVDDLLVKTSKNGLVFIQSKKNVGLSDSENSDLGSAIDQFVRQFLNCRSKKEGKQPWDRPLDPTRDRLVLVTSSKSPGSVRNDLQVILQRLRELPQDQFVNYTAPNIPQDKAFSVLKKLIIRSWEKELKQNPSNEELLQVCRLIYVSVLDLENEGIHATEAKDRLRNVVLVNPDDSEAAWSHLIRVSAQLSQQSGTDLPHLQEELLKARFLLKGPGSFSKDIERLKEYSTETLASIAHHSQIAVDSGVVKIHRASTKTLLKVAKDGSILVTGEPGAGKSGTLFSFVESLRAENHDFIFFAVDRLESGNLAGIRRELNLDHDLIKILDSWPGAQPAFLVIDALDAGRGEPAMKMVQDLIRQVIEKNNRWRVIASIRKFDLRYGIDFQELFTGSPVHGFMDEEFKAIRHLNVPILSDSEINQVTSRSSQIQALFKTGSITLQNLLKVPFNLKLISELVKTGTTTQELGGLNTQLQLLERYWLCRVIPSGSSADNREKILRTICKKMVQNRAMRINRSEILQGEENPSQLEGLLSDQILNEWKSTPDAQVERYILAFSHHVLFDYAVSRLLLRCKPEDFINQLTQDLGLVLVIRPSFTLHFHYLWTVDPSHHQFWELVFKIVQTDQIPEIGKLIGPSVAAEVIRDLSDLNDVFITLENPHSLVYSFAEKILYHLFGALLAGRDENRPLTGSNAGPWCQLLERLSRNFQPTLAYDILTFLRYFCERSNELTVKQLDYVGPAARRLLEFAWSQQRREKWLVTQSLQCVCRTFKSDPSSSSSLIKRALEAEHFSKYGFEEMPCLAREIKVLIRSGDSNLIQEIYSVAFRNPETSEELAPLNQSQIISLSSSRRQNYDGALYDLGRAFPLFLEQAPALAIQTLILVMENYVSRDHSIPMNQDSEEIFDCDGYQVHILTDYSRIWDTGTYRHDKPLEMLKHFKQYLEGLIKRSESDEIFQLLLSKNRLAVIWRLVLILGAKYPDSLGKSILPFAWAIPILTCSDTTVLAGKFIKAIYSNLNLKEREKIERAILGVSESELQADLETQEYTRNRLLGCLADFELTTKEAQAILNELKLKKAIPPNEPSVRVEISVKRHEEEDDLREKGVPVEKEANRKLRELEKPVKEFANTYLNSKPVPEEILNIFPSLKKLHEALSTAAEDGAHIQQSTYAWHYLAQACVCIAKAIEPSWNMPVYEFVKLCLLQASSHLEPVHEPQYDAQFDRFQSYGTPAPRVQAAEGLITLLRHKNYLTSEILETIEKLVHDPVPAVRYQLSFNLHNLYKTAPDLMWRLMDYVSNHERSRGVLKGLLIRPFQRLQEVEGERLVNLAKIIFDRFRNDSAASEIRELCIAFFSGTYIWQGHALCREIVLNILTNFSDYVGEAPSLLTDIREAMTYGSTDHPDSAQDLVRQRALSLIDQLLESAHGELTGILNRNSKNSSESWSTEDKDRAKLLRNLIDSIGKEVYFSSGAFDSKRPRHGEETQPLAPERLKRFYDEVKPVMEKLAAISLPEVTHHLLETLEFFIPFDPVGVFLSIGHVILSGQKGRYQNESLGADLVVKLIERYLAEYRTLFRENTECRHVLIEILDTFVQAGWFNARRLTYHLDGILR